MVRRVLAGLAVALLAWCCSSANGTGPAPAEPSAAPAPAPSGSGNAQIANPASGNCVEKGGKLEIIDGTGGQTGVCVFADGSRCEEWRLFRGECAPGACREATGVCPPGGK